MMKRKVLIINTKHIKPEQCLAVTSANRVPTFQANLKFATEEA